MDHDQHGVPGGTGDVLTSEGSRPGDGQRRSRGRRVLVAVGLGLAVLCAGGGAYAYAALSGGGAQPESVVPADAVAFAKLDLDPSAGQKLAALRFARHFPQAEAGSGDDPAQALGHAVFTEAASGLDYERDVKPWIGDRVAVAAVPAPAAALSSVDALLVVQYRDKEKAQAALEKARAHIRAGARVARTAAEDSGDGSLDETGQGPFPRVNDLGWVLRDGYAVLAQDQARADRLSRSAAGGALSDNRSFRRGLASLDGDQVALVWADGARVTDLAKRAARAGGHAGGGAALDRVRAWRGSMTVGLHFTSGSMEITGRVAGLSGTAGAGRTSDLVPALPAGTLAALSTTGLDALVGDVWRSLEQVGGPTAQQLRSLSRSTGLDLPADLQAVLGSQTAVSVGGHLDAEAGPDVALRSVTADPRRAERAVKALLDDPERPPDEPLPFTVRATGRGVVVATSSRYLQSVASGGGGLGRDPRFRAALPDAPRAGTLAWADLAGLVREDSKTASEDGGPQPVDPNAAPLDAFGLTVVRDGSTAELHARLTVR